MDGIKSKGIDISQWQGNIDFRAVKNSGVEFIIPRDGYGVSTIDPNFLTYVKNAKLAGIKVPAIYHFSYALNEEQAREEAVKAVEYAKKAGLPSSTIIFFDLEYDSVDYAKKYAVNIDRTRCCKHTEAFCQKVIDLGYKTGIYANQDYCNRMYTADIIKKYPLWLANWNGGKKPSTNCIIHQWNDKGRVGGINGNVDMNNAYIDFEDVPQPKTLTEEELNKVVSDVMDGKYGNGNERKIKLAEAGYDYSIVQKAVDNYVQSQIPEAVEPEEPSKPELRPISEMVNRVMAGEYGNGEDRKRRLEAEGYNYTEIQNEVNKAVEARKINVPAKSFDKKIAGTYVVTAELLNCRTKPGVMTPDTVITTIKKGTRVQCYGYYTDVAGAWYLIQYGNVVGFVAHNYLKRV